MRKRLLIRAIGLTGVAPDENPRARAWGRRLESPMLVLAVWIVVEWYAEAQGVVPRGIAVLTDWLVWLAFVTETLLLVALVDRKVRYLRENWMNLVIIGMGIPVLWNGAGYVAALRTLRLFVMLILLVHSSRTVRRLLATNHLGATLAVAAAVVVMGGVIIAALEPGITSAWDGIWWAWVTVTTVGYGDIVPRTPEGRAFGSLLILFGIALFSLLTANFAAFLISREEAQIMEEEESALARLREVERRLERMEHTLRRLCDSLEQTRGQG